MYPYMKPKNEHSVIVSDEMVKKLLTESEWRMVKQRQLILNLLDEGLTVRSIAEKVKVGTDTVVRVSKLARKKNLKGSTSSLKRIKTSTPWIFGKSD